MDSESKKPSNQANNPLHGVTLKAIVTELEARYGWHELGVRIPIRCFLYEPSLNSSLKFLRKTPWAREKVERLYLLDLANLHRKQRKNRMRAARRAHRAETHGSGEE